MFYKIKYTFLVCVLLIACNSNNTETAITESVESESTPPVTLEVLMENEKIKIGTIQKKNVARTIQCTGQIEIPPTEVSSIHSKINGQITFLKYLPGDFIKKGTLLTSVENSQLVEKQRIFLETKANLSFARKDFERKKILKEGQATPEKTFDESQNRYELLQATYSGLKKELELLGISIEALETESKFQSSVNVYAPQSGYLHEVLINKGQMISPETRLMEIANINHLHLELKVLSKDVGAIYKGQEVNFNIPNRTETFKAKVIKINPMLQKEQSSLQVHCIIEHPDKHIFVAGLFANATIQTKESAVEGLPLSAVVKEGEDFFAYKIIDKNVVKTPLNNAVAANEFVLFDGAKEGQWVIGGAYYIK